MKYNQIKTKLNEHSLGLLKKVVAQIDKDARNGDYTTIDELLENIPEEQLEDFLSDNLYPYVEEDEASDLYHDNVKGKSANDLYHDNVKSGKDYNDYKGIQIHNLRKELKRVRKILLNLQDIEGKDNSSDMVNDIRNMLGGYETMIDNMESAFDKLEIGRHRKESTDESDHTISSRTNYNLSDKGGKQKDNFTQHIRDYEHGKGLSTMTTAQQHDGSTSTRLITPGGSGWDVQNGVEKKIQMKGPQSWAYDKPKAKINASKKVREYVQEPTPGKEDKFTGQEINFVHELCLRHDGVERDPAGLKYLGKSELWDGGNIIYDKVALAKLMAWVEENKLDIESRFKNMFRVYDNDQNRDPGSDGDKVLRNINSKIGTGEVAEGDMEADKKNPHAQPYLNTQSGKCYTIWMIKLLVHMLNINQLLELQVEESKKV